MAFFLRRLNLYSKRHPPGVIDRIDAKYCKQTFYLSAQEILLLWNRPWQCSNSEWIFFLKKSLKKYSLVLPYVMYFQVLSRTDPI